MKDKDFLGKKGELIAKNYLIANHYKILHTNWFYGHKELDVVAIKENCLHIVEVKTRSTSYWQQAADAVTHRKQKMIIQATEAYMCTFNLDLEVSFDVVFIVFEAGKTPTVEFIEDAFFTYE